MQVEKRFGQEVTGTRVRTTDRVQTLISAKLTSDSGEPETFVITDISTDGCTGTCSQSLTVGAGATLSLANGEVMNATVKWNDGIKAGLHFDFPLTFRKLLAIKHSDPSDGMPSTAQIAPKSGNSLSALFNRVRGR